MQQACCLQFYYCVLLTQADRRNIESCNSTVVHKENVAKFSALYPLCCKCSDVLIGALCNFQIVLALERVGLRGASQEKAIKYQKAEVPASISEFTAHFLKGKLVRQFQILNYIIACSMLVAYSFIAA